MFVRWLGLYGILTPLKKFKQFILTIFLMNLVCIASCVHKIQLQQKANTCRREWRLSDAAYSPSKCWQTLQDTGGNPILIQKGNEAEPQLSSYPPPQTHCYRKHSWTLPHNCIKTSKSGASVCTHVPPPPEYYPLPSFCWSFRFPGSWSYALQHFLFIYLGNNTTKKMYFLVN